MTDGQTDRRMEVIAVSPTLFKKKCGDKNRSEVKVKVKVTTKWYAPIRHPKKSPHTKFVIPTSKNLGDTFKIRLFLKLGHRSRSQ